MFIQLNWDQPDINSCSRLSLRFPFKCSVGRSLHSHLGGNYSRWAKPYLMLFRDRNLWPLLLPTSRGWSSCFDFTYGEGALMSLIIFPFSPEQIGQNVIISRNRLHTLTVGTHVFHMGCLNEADSATHQSLVSCSGAFKCTDEPSQRSYYCILCITSAVYCPLRAPSLCMNQYQ